MSWPDDPIARSQQCRNLRHNGQVLEQGCLIQLRGEQSTIVNRCGNRTNALSRSCKLSTTISLNEANIRSTLDPSRLHQWRCGPSRPADPFPATNIRQLESAAGTPHLQPRLTILMPPDSSSIRVQDWLHDQGPCPERCCSERCRMSRCLVLSYIAASSRLWD